jgi:hypothetical protein
MSCAIGIHEEFGRKDLLSLQSYVDSYLPLPWSLLRRPSTKQQ